MVTGGAGFIGSHLSEALVARGDSVVIFDDLSTGSLDNILPLLERERAEFVQASILDREMLERSMNGCDEVYHLASVVGVMLVLQRPSHGIAVNTLGTEYVFDAAEAVGARVLFASSSEVYGTACTSVLTEDDSRLYGSPDKLRWSYASSKAMSEFSAQARYHEREASIVTVRLFNTVGPRQSEEYGMVLPRFVRQALDGSPITIFGDGTQKRCFSWVGDVVDAMMALRAGDAHDGGIYNLGSDEEVSIAELASLVIAQTGSDSPIQHIPYEQAYPLGYEEIYKRVPDLGRIHQAIGYTPSRRLPEIIASVAGSLSTASVQPKRP